MIKPLLKLASSKENADIPAMSLPLEIDQETDGRWIAEIPSIPGCMAYGETREAAVRAVEALALRVMADRVSML